jgi:signal transduction histidine kinase
LAKLTTQTQRLATFSDRILDVYQMETGQLKLQLRPVPVHLLVNQVIEHWQSNLTHSISTRFEETKSPWIWADEKAFESVLNNLIENAIKYSPPYSRIEIIVESTLDKKVLCGVKDQGPGVDRTVQNKIFNRFYRVNAGDSQKVYGHGLGLYIAKNLVELMNGEISVESEPGKGSFFKFTLPLMEESLERENINY